MPPNVGATRTAQAEAAGVIRAKQIAALCYQHRIRHSKLRPLNAARKTVEWIKAVKNVGEKAKGTPICRERTCPCSRTIENRRGPESKYSRRSSSFIRGSGRPREAAPGAGPVAPNNERGARLCTENARSLVDPASSHMLVSKIKPCKSQYMPH